MFPKLSEVFYQFYLKFTNLIPNIFLGIVVMLVFYALGRFFYSSVGKRIQKKWRDNLVSQLVAEASKWGFYTVGALVALNLVGFGGVASSLLAGAGIGAIVLGFAFKDIGENFLAGILLAMNRPFEIGDIIEVSEFKGTVSGLDLRTTHLRNAGGKDIYIPNSMIVKNTVTNYTKDGFLRLTFVLGIAQDEDIGKTQQLILNYLSEQPRVLKSPRPDVIVENLGEFTTDLSVLFWIDIISTQKLPDSNLGINLRGHIIKEVKELLDKNEVNMPSQILEHKMYRNENFNIENKG